MTTDQSLVAEHEVPPPHPERPWMHLNEFEGGTASGSEIVPLLLTAAEIEVMLCFTLTSPLYYGPVEESLCDKLRGYMQGQFRFRAAPTAER